MIVYYHRGSTLPVNFPPNHWIYSAPHLTRAQGRVWCADTLHEPAEFHIPSLKLGNNELG